MFWLAILLVLASFGYCANAAPQRQRPANPTASGAAASAARSPATRPADVKGPGTTAVGHDAAISFAHDVLPVLQASCVGCHGGASPSGGLDLTSYGSLMKGGKGGKEIVAGHGAESRIIQYLTGTLQPKMPVGGDLKPAEIERIRRWIDEGASEGAPLPAGGGPGAVVAPALDVPTPVTALAYSPEGHTLAVGCYQQVQFWDVASRRLRGAWRGHAGAVHALAYSRDGRWLAASGGRPAEMGEVRLWDVAAGREARTLGEHTDVVNAIAFSPNGHTLASGSSDKTLKLWDVATGRSLQTLKDHADAVFGLAWSPDGKYLASSSADRSVKVWDAATGHRLYSISDDARPAVVYDVEFSRDGKRLIAATSNKSAVILDFGPESSTRFQSLGGHRHNVLAATFSPDGRLAATASADRTVKLWSVGDGRNTRTLTDARDWVYAVRFSPDGSHLAAGAWDGSVLLWRVADGKLELRLSTGPAANSRPALVAGQSEGAQ